MVPSSEIRQAGSRECASNHSSAQLNRKKKIPKEFSEINEQSQKDPGMGHPWGQNWGQNKTSTHPPQPGIYCIKGKYTFLKKKIIATSFINSLTYCSKQPSPLRYFESMAFIISLIFNISFWYWLDVLFCPQFWYWFHVFYKPSTVLSPLHRLNAVDTIIGIPILQMRERASEWWSWVPGSLDLQRLPWFLRAHEMKKE